MEVKNEKIDAIEEEEEEEEVIEEEEEEEEEFEEVEEEEEEVGGGKSQEKGVEIEVVGSGAVEEIKQSDPVDGSSSSSSSSGKIFVGGVARETTEDAFAKHFIKYGEIVDSVIMKDKHTQLPRGFGFITFADPAVIDKVLEDQHVIDGKPVEVKRTVPREDMTSKVSFKTKKIFVGGISTSLTEDEFKKHFASYGEVVEHQIMIDHSTGRSRGFGFVTFKDEDTVEKIISNGKMQDLQGKQVEIKKAEPKKAGGDPGFNGRAAFAAGVGNAYATSSVGASGYGGGYRPGNIYYGANDGGYGRGYGYGGALGYGAGYNPNFGGPMYGVGGGYGAGYGYGGPGGYGGPYGGYGGGRGFGSRYHPYGR